MKKVRWLACRDGSHKVDDVDFRSTNEVELLIVVSDSNATAHNLLYGGGCLCSRVCACVCEGVSMVSCNKSCRIDIKSIDD
jgi:hypothetical protein